MKQGLPLNTPWSPVYWIGRFEVNAGRTLTPEFAQYQPLLDKAWLDKQAKRPKFLKSRHNKRDSKGRFVR